MSEWWKSPKGAIEEKDYFNQEKTSLKCVNPEKRLSKEEIRKLNVELIESIYGKQK